MRLGNKQSIDTILNIMQYKLTKLCYTITDIIQKSVLHIVISQLTLHDHTVIICYYVFEG
jgi:hypothetical protein